MSLDQQVTDVIAALLDTDVGRLSTTTELTAIDGWDSINSLRVLIYLEHSLGVSMDYEQFQAAATVGDLIAVADQAASRAVPRHG